MKTSLVILLILCLYTTLTVAQNTSQISDTLVHQGKKNKKSLKSSSDNLYNSILNEESNKVASDYYQLAMDLAGEGDYTRAETYMQKAIAKEKLKKTTKNLALYYRELAKIQEAQKKYEEASGNYKNAAANGNDKTKRRINENDANRLQYKDSPQEQLKYASQNSAILNQSNNRQEQVENYAQQAEINKNLNKKEEAIENYKSAIELADSTSSNSAKLRNDLANLLVQDKNFEEAINIQQEAVNNAKFAGNRNAEIKELRNLSTIYFASNKIPLALYTLKEAYQLAIKRRSVKEARASLVTLAEYYEKNQFNKEVIALYKGFVQQLDSLITGDSTLIDRNLFLINESRISKLEQEKALKDELIERKNKYNYVLIGSIILLMLLLLVIIKAWISIRKRNKRIALQSLRREMNPHFIFNSLNSVNQFIAENNELEANKYLTSYSNLMRAFMDNSNKDYITLNTEVEQLTKYLDLEKLRFADKFDYILEVDDGINTEETLVPNMLIQPNAENAIWHGLRYKQTKGSLTIRFRKNGLQNMVIIEDDGIGLEQSRSIKTENQKLHRSLGLNNVKERIRLLNELYHANIRLEISEKQGNGTGVMVKILW